jgi:hypothetical protein
VFIYLYNANNILRANGRESVKREGEIEKKDSESLEKKVFVSATSLQLNKAHQQP